MALTNGFRNFSFFGKYIYLKNTSTKNAQIQLKATYSVGPTKLSAPTGLQVTNMTATSTSASAALTWDEVENASGYEVLVVDPLVDYRRTINPASNPLVLNDLTPSTSYLWSVKALGDGETYEYSEDAIVEYFTTPAPPTLRFTVTFNPGTNGTCETESLKESSPGAGVTLPSCTPNAGFVFKGWATMNTATEAEYEAGATSHPIDNITLYAVYNEVYTITWSVNGTTTTDGNPTTSVVEGEVITTLPTTPADISGMKFQGWTATQIATSSASAPDDLFTDANAAPAITGNTTFYAVFAEESTVTETLVIKDYANANSWTSGQAYTSASTANVTFTGAGTGNNCKYYSSDQSWRFYSSGNGAITITAPGNITKVELSTMLSTAC